MYVVFKIQWINKFGFRGEIHEVQTEDGFILRTHRVLPKYNNRSKKLPFFIFPGFLCPSGFYLIPQSTSIGFYLSSLGFDVWLPNARGTIYSLKHTRLNLNETDFWDFSFHEIGRYDLPATINYALNVTKSQKLFFVGHSQGCLTIHIMMSYRPEFNSKISSAYFMGPGYLTDVPSFHIRQLLTSFSVVERQHYGVLKVFKRLGTPKKSTKFISFCYNMQSFCQFIYQGFFGYNDDNRSEVD